MKTLYYNTLITLLFLCVGSSALNAAQISRSDSLSSVRSPSQTREDNLLYEYTPVSINIFCPNRHTAALSYQKLPGHMPHIVVNLDGLNVAQQGSAQHTQSSGAVTAVANSTRMTTQSPIATPTGPQAPTYQEETSQQATDAPVTLLSQATVSAQQARVQSPQSSSSAITTPASSAPFPSHKLTPNQIAQLQELSKKLALFDSLRKADSALSSQREKYLAMWTNKMKRSLTIKKRLALNTSQEQCITERFEAIRYEQGLEGKERDIYRAAILYRQAAEHGDALSQTYLAIGYLLAKEYKKALALLTTASEKFDYAKIVQTYCYQYGIGTEKNAEFAAKLLGTSSRYQEDPDAVLLDLEYLHNIIKLGL